ncbi:hypothetical protein BFJ70_g17207 [Fusarium oxysporum]|nr:hypothetical protein BFJ70_g17207 [Fusarium oxysporum]
MNFACYDIGATFLYNAASLLKAIRTAAPHSARQMPCYTGKFGWYDAQRAHLETTDNRQRWAQDKAALLEVVPDITLLFEIEGIPVLDEFARGVKYMFETQEIPVWLCFAMQNYLDTLRSFRPNITKVLAEFHRFNEITADLLDCANLADYHQNDAKKDLEDIYKMVMVKLNGVDIFIASRMALDCSSCNNRASRSSSFLLYNQLFCGLWIHYARVLLHQTGARYIAKPGAVLHAVQLYTAVRQQQQQQQQQEEEEEEHLVPVPEWPDFDRLVAMQGLQAFFVGTEPPASLQAYFKNYCMSRGVSPANWLAAANRRKGKQGKVLLQRSRAGIRELKFGAPVSLCCAARMEKRAIAEPTRRVWNAEVMQQILETSDRKIKAKAKAAPAHPTLTAPQLVHYVAHAIQTEMPDLVFDYFAMHKMAQGLLKKVRAQADDIGLPLMPYVTTDVADIAGLVFAVAAKEMASKSGQSQGVLGKVAMVIREHRPDSRFAIHNHEPTWHQSAHPTHRTLSDNDKTTISGLTNAGVAPKDIRTYIRQKSNTIATQQDIYNRIADSKRELCEGQSTIHAFANQLDKEGFWNRMQLDSHDRVTAVLFAHPESLAYLKAYPDLLFLDCTYKTNKYGMPLLDIIGVDACQRSFCIAFAFLSGESEEDYTWALGRLRSMYELCGAALPSVILTDRCLACMNAVARCFPTAISLLCLWHANKAVLRYCQPTFTRHDQGLEARRESLNDWNEFFNCWHSIVRSADEKTFDQRVKGLEERYLPQYLEEVGYIKANWLDLYKEKLVKAWVDQYPGLQSTPLNPRVDPRSIPRGWSAGGLCNPSIPLEALVEWMQWI